MTGGRDPTTSGGLPEEMTRATGRASTAMTAVANTVKTPMVRSP